MFVRLLAVYMTPKHLHFISSKAFQASSLGRIVGDRILFYKLIRKMLYARDE